MALLAPSHERAPKEKTYTQQKSPQRDRRNVGTRGRFPIKPALLLYLGAIGPTPGPRTYATDTRPQDLCGRRRGFLREIAQNRQTVLRRVLRQEGRDEEVPGDTIDTP